MLLFKIKPIGFAANTATNAPLAPIVYVFAASCGSECTIYELSEPFVIARVAFGASIPLIQSLQLCQPMHDSDNCLILEDLKLNR